MPLTIIVGAQYGGEGKGSITAYLSSKGQGDILIKTGGPNSAHSFGTVDSMHRVRMVPSGANFGSSAIVFPSGCLIHVDTLFQELNGLNYQGRILVDPNAGVVDSDTVAAQNADGFYERVGSTMTGTGHAVSRRALRRLQLARDEPRLAVYLEDTKKFLSDALSCGRRVVAEGSQAYGLSNYHGEYPFVSSRDTTAGEVLAQVGLGPYYISTIILVVKCFPTRNRGGNGALPHELTREFIASYPVVFDERGGGAYNGGDHLRRVGLFDLDIVEQACIANTPTAIALTGVDRVDALIHHPIIRKHYGDSAEAFIRSLEDRLGRKVALVARGPYISDVALRTSRSEEAVA